MTLAATARRTGWRTWFRRTLSQNRRNSPEQDGGRQGGGDALRLELPRVHWVRPEIVVEVTYLTWTEVGLLRAVSYQGQREDKMAEQVVRSIPHAARQ